MLTLRRIDFLEALDGVTQHVRHRRRLPGFWIGVDVNILACNQQIIASVNFKQELNARTADARDAAIDVDFFVVVGRGLVFHRGFDDI